MGFSYNDITSKSMGLKARLTSWQVSGRLRNFTTTVPGKYGVTDFGADFDYRETWFPAASSQGTAFPPWFPRWMILRRGLTRWAV